MGRASRTIKDILSQYSVDENGCWNWSKGCDKDGYGKVTHNYQDLRAHRVSYEHHIGPIPDGLFVLHNCDNPPCINPAHLYAGTAQKNIDDKVARDRLNPPMVTVMDFDYILKAYHEDRITQTPNSPKLS
jgi:HNH endonuclease